MGPYCLVKRGETSTRLGDVLSLIGSRLVTGGPLQPHGLYWRTDIHAPIMARACLSPELAPSDSGLQNQETPWENYSALVVNMTAQSLDQIVYGQVWGYVLIVNHVGGLSSWWAGPFLGDMVLGNLGESGRHEPG